MVWNWHDTEVTIITLSLAWLFIKKIPCVIGVYVFRNTCLCTVVLWINPKLGHRMMTSLACRWRILSLQEMNMICIKMYLECFVILLCFVTIIVLLVSFYLFCFCNQISKSRFAYYLITPLASVMWHLSLPLIISFDKTEAAIFLMLTVLPEDFHLSSD